MSNLLYSSKEEIFPGLWVYRDVIKQEIDVINRLESTIKDSNGLYNWQDATVGYREKIPEYRDCVDFKLKFRVIHRFSYYYYCYYFIYIILG